MLGENWMIWRLQSSRDVHVYCRVGHLGKNFDHQKVNASEK